MNTTQFIAMHIVYGLTLGYVLYALVARYDAFFSAYQANQKKHLETLKRIEKALLFLQKSEIDR